MGYNDDSYRRQQEEDRRREQERRDQQRRDDEIRLQDERRREQQAREERQRAEERAREERAREERQRAEERAREEQRRKDNEVTYARRREDEERAYTKKRDLDEISRTRKADLDNNARQLNEDLWNRADRERAAQDETFKKIELEKHARRLAEKAAAAASTSAGRTKSIPNLLDAEAIAGMDAIFSLLGAFGSGTSPRDLSEISLHNLTSQIQTLDIEAESRAALLDTVTAQFEPWMKEQKDQAALNELRGGRSEKPTGCLDEPWNKDIWITWQDAFNWENVAVKFPEVRPAALLSEEAKKGGDGWGEAIIFPEFTHKPGAEPRLDARQNFVNGYASSPLFSGTYNRSWYSHDSSQFTVSPRVAAYLYLRGEPNELVTEFKVQFKGKAEYLNAIEIFRKANLVTFHSIGKHTESDRQAKSPEELGLQLIRYQLPNSTYPLPHTMQLYPYANYIPDPLEKDLPIPVEQLVEMQENGKIYRLTLERLVRLRQLQLDALYAQGRAVGQQLYDGLKCGSREEFDRLWHAKYGQYPTDIEYADAISNGRKYFEAREQVGKSEPAGKKGFWKSLFGG